MTEKQNAKKDMYQAVLQVLLENQSYYKEIPVFEEAVTEMENTLIQMGDLVKQQIKATLKGIMNTKNEIETHLVNETLKISAVLSVLVKDLKDENLLIEVLLTKSMMYHSPKNEMLNMSQRVLAKATTYAHELQDYGIKDTDILTLQTLVNDYDKIMTVPRVVISESKQATATLVELFAYADTLLNDRLDKLMQLFKDSAPDFYALYFNTRNIINTAARKRKTDEQEEEKGEGKEE
jgi:hypothetical protein